MRRRCAELFSYLTSIARQASRQFALFPSLTQTWTLGSLLVLLLLKQHTGQSRVGLIPLGELVHVQWRSNFCCSSGMRVMLLLFSSCTSCGRQLGTASSHIATLSSETIHRGCYVEGWTGTFFPQFFGQALLICYVVRVLVSVCYAVHRGIYGAPMRYLCENFLRPFLAIQKFTCSRSG